MVDKILDKIRTNNSHYPPGFTYGGDPEIFLAQGDSIIGAERVIPENGLFASSGSLVLDGVQAELHPPASACRSGFSNSIRAILIELKKSLNQYEGTSVSFKGVVEVPREELDKLSDKAKILGCAESKNAYAGGASAELARVDASKYRTRSAGGHIHVGLPSRPLHPDVQKAWREAQNGYYLAYRAWSDRTKGNISVEAPPVPPIQPTNPDVVNYPPELLARLMDIIVGNTCVLLDRDPKAAERRKLYGRAGEYRTPPHGFEYRTLSNFWLRSLPLTSFVFGLTRMAMALPYANGTYSPAYVQELTSRVDEKRIRKAINQNDADLALKTWEEVRKFILEMYQESDDSIQLGYYAGFSLDSRNMVEFDYFLSKGLDHWFKEDPLTHWTNLPVDTHRFGWESYLINKVRPQRIAEEKGKKVA